MFVLFIVVVFNLPQLFCSMEEAAASQQRIRGLAAATIAVPLHKAWEIASDFYGLQKWVPTIRKCYQIEPGVRYAESYPVNGKVAWVKEKLTGLSPSQHKISYRIIAGNFGLSDYAATLKLARAKDGQTIVHWSFGMSSRSTRTKEQQEEYLKMGIQSLEKAAKKKNSVNAAAKENRNE